MKGIIERDIRAKCFFQIRHLRGQLDELRPVGPRLSRDRLRQEEGGRHLRGHRAESWDHSCPRSWSRVLSMHVSLLNLTPFASNSDSFNPNFH